MSCETSCNIDNMAQNHPELVVRDLKKYIPENVIRTVLKMRGINKWLRNRRLLIQLKDTWKKEIKVLQEQYEKEKKGKHYRKAAECRIRMNTLADVRQQVRAICHSPRDVNFNINSTSFTEVCNLPPDFPQRPSKNYFCK